MQADVYQALAARTLPARPDAVYTDQETMLVWNAIGLGGESGEVLDIIKKGVFHRHGVDREKLGKELGDVLWYVSAICEVSGIALADVMEKNIAKLKARYPEGYSSAASKSRPVDA